MKLQSLLKSFSLAVLFSTTALYYNFSSRNNEQKKKAELHVHNRQKITITHIDGLVETRAGGSAAWRHNNPGNLVYGKIAEKHGAIGQNGRWAVFPNYETGNKASIALLKSKAYINLTINEAIARRSPPNENDTPRLQAKVRKLGKFSGNEKIGYLTEKQLKKLVEIIQKLEGWKPGSVVTNNSAVLSDKTKPPQRNS